MGIGRPIAIAVAVWAFAGSASAASKKELPPPPGDEPEGPGPEPDPVLKQVFDDNVAEVPTLGMGYQLVKGDTYRGPNGIVARAAPQLSPQDRVAYIRVMTRLLSNWRLYGALTTGHTAPLDRINIPAGPTGGAPAVGNINAALNKVNDSWPIAISKNELPARLIRWNRNKNTGKVQPVAGWRDRMHGHSRRYGLVMMPPLSCLEEGGLPPAACDWPADLWVLTQTSRDEWQP